MQSPIITILKKFQYPELFYEVQQMYLMSISRSGSDEMKVAVLGAGMMGRAIAYDLLHKKTFGEIILVDMDQQTLDDSRYFLSNTNLKTVKANVAETDSLKEIFSDVDVAISAIPYYFNYDLTKLAIDTGTHFIDLGGNNDVVRRQRQLDPLAKKQQVTVIPDSGLAPGLVSVITKDIVESLSTVDLVQLRVGGLPLQPQPPLKYQIVFSINGLINEYVEDALILDHGKIISKPSMTEIETILFPEPFGRMEAFLTSGGCSTLPYTYKNTIGYLDYKTIRYPGHCDRFKTMLDIGLGDTHPVEVDGHKVIPRDLFIRLLHQSIPSEGSDVVLLKAVGKGMRKNVGTTIEYTMIDTYDEETHLSAMMRTTVFPVAITADFIARKVINEPGVFCPEEIIPPALFFKELEKRNIVIEKTEKEIL